MRGLNSLAALIQRRSGIVIGADKQYLLESRLAPLLRREGMRTLDQLATRLSRGGCCTLEQDVTEAVATHETLFFRDTKTFDHLQAVALPRLLAARPDGSRLRIWSAAAATGQETYSLAMTLAESGITSSDQAEILGTDLAAKPLERARAGSYTQYEVQRGLSVLRLLQHFRHHGRNWDVTPDLRQMCRFQQWNLLDDPAPLGRFDIVFCRNVLFYFSRGTRVRVLANIRRHMAPDGLLYLGAAETASGLDDALVRDGPAYSLVPGSSACGAVTPSHRGPQPAKDTRPAFA